MSIAPIEQPKESFDLKEFLRPFFRRWFWFLLSTLVCVIFAFLTIRYEVPVYLAQASVNVVDSESSSELQVFQDLNILSNEGQSSIEDEILLVNSRANMREVVKRLRLNVRVFSLGNIIDSEMYKNLPFNIDFNIPDSVVYNSSFRFYLRVSSNSTFGYALDEDGSYEPYQLGSPLETPMGQIIITPNYKNFENLYGDRYRVEIIPVNAVAQNYKGRIQIIPSQPGSRVLDVFLTDPILNKAKDIINTLISVYNEKTVSDKKAIADRTSEFINDRINNLSAELSTVDQSAEEFKSERGVTDIGTQATLNLSEESTYEAELQETQIQLNTAASMKSLIDNTEGYDFLPSNIGLTDATIAGTTARYNELASRRKQLLESSNESNPVVRNLDQQLESLKQNMSSSLNSMVNNLQLQSNSLSKRIASISSRLYSAPRNERALRDITRKQETKEALFLYLMEKREEAQIAFASTEPNVRIIDSSYSLSNAPVGMDHKIIYIGAILIGLFIPFSIIYVDGLLDTKIHHKLELEKLVNDIPVVGELPKLNRKNSKLIQLEDRSVLAESLRILRTNMDYLLKSKDSTDRNENIIFITSSVAEEGKTLTASNLALVIANSGKKVVLVGADIRNPKLLSFFKDNKVVFESRNEIQGRHLGLTEYLFNKSLSPDDLIQSVIVNKTELDVIYSGKIPPNPAELLRSSKLENFFATLSASYDYVIVDTAPLLVVSDTMVISKYASHLLYVVRAGKTEKKVIGFPLKLAREGKLKNFSFVINDVENSDLGYGGKYGYGYSSDRKKPWYRRS